MPRSRPLRALNQRRQLTNQIHQQVGAHSRWLDRLVATYGRPRVELIALLAAPGALEYEIARLISDAALAKARQLLADRERPDEDSPDLFDRAVAGHWRGLRDAEIAASAGTIAELKAALG